MIFMRIPLWLPVLMLLLGVAWPANDLGFPLDRALLQPLVPCGALFFSVCLTPYLTRIQLAKI